MAYTNVRRGGKPIEAAEEYLGADRTISIDDIGSGTGDIEVVDKVLTTDKLETEKFMAEKSLSWSMSRTTTPTTILCRPGVNGRGQMFLRGEVSGSPPLLRRSSRTGEADHVQARPR